MKDEFSWPWVSSGLWNGPSPRNLQKVLIIAPSRKRREGGHKILPLVQHLNVNFKNMSPSYPFTSFAVQLNLGGPVTGGQQKVYAWAIVKCQNRHPARHFHSLTPFPILYGLSEKMGKKWNLFSPHSQPCFLRQPKSNKIWSRVMTEPATYCNFQCVVSPCEQLKS